MRRFSMKFAGVLLALTMIVSLHAHGQRATLLFPALQGPQGQNIPNAHLTFCSVTNPQLYDSLGNCTATVQVYKDSALTQPYSSAIQTDGVGNFPPNQVTTTALWFSPNLTLCYTATGGGINNSVFKCTPFSISVAGSNPSFVSVNKIVAVSASNPQGWGGANESAWINSAIATLSGSPGIVDARGLGSTGTISVTIAVPASVHLDLGSTNFTCTVRPCLTYSNNSVIVGTNMGSCLGATGGTTITINDATAGNIVGPASTGNTNGVLIQNICLNGTSIQAGQVGLDFTNTNNSRTDNIFCSALSVCQQTQIVAPGTTAYYNKHYNLQDQASTTSIRVDEDANAQEYFGGKSNAAGTCADIGENGTQTNQVEFHGFVCEASLTNGYKFGPKANNNSIHGGRIETNTGTGLVCSSCSFGNGIYETHRFGSNGATVTDTSNLLTIIDPGSTVIQLSGNSLSTLTMVNGGIIKSILTSTTANPAVTGWLRPSSSDQMCWRNNANNSDVCVAKNASDQLNLLAFGGVFADPLFMASSNLSGAGDIRFQVGQSIGWRNSANNGDLLLGIDASDRLKFNSSLLPLLYNAAGTLQTNPHWVQDTCTLGTNCTVTFSGSAAFTSATTYTCTCHDQTTPLNACGVNQTGGAGISITGTGTDVIRYHCSGN